MAKRILLVDDEPLILKGLKFSLEQDGYETDSATDGEQALKMIQSNNYDLVLLDVMLPGLSGIEVCQRTRETSDVPIIMLTAKAEYLIHILALCCEHDYWYVACFAHYLANLYARKLGQHNVEQHKVVMPCVQLFQCLLAVRSGIRFIAVLLKRALESLYHQRLVVYK